MPYFEIFVILAFAVMVGTLLGAAALVLMVGNELRARNLPEIELAKAAAVERQLLEADLGASGGRQSDAWSLSAERLAGSGASTLDAANDPGRPETRVFQARGGRRCKFCARVREKILHLVHPLSRRHVAATTSPEGHGKRG